MERLAVGLKGLRIVIDSLGGEAGLGGKAIPGPKLPRGQGKGGLLRFPREGSKPAGVILGFRTIGEAHGQASALGRAGAEDPKILRDVHQLEGLFSGVRMGGFRAWGVFSEPKRVMGGDCPVIPVRFKAQGQHGGALHVPRRGVVIEVRRLHGSPPVA